MIIRNTFIATATVLALSLGATGCAVKRDQQTVGAYVDDTTITTQVKARFVDNKQVDASSIKVETLNGTVIHENVELAKGPTPGGLTGKEAATGPLMFQGDHGPVAFRGIKITPK